MGFFKNLLNDAAEELKKKAEEAKNQVIQNVKGQFNDFNNDDNEDSRIPVGKYENGVLEIREGLKKLDYESIEKYEHVHKVIVPSSLQKLEEDIFLETKELEELDFSRVTELKEIPEGLVSCKTKIKEFVIPEGVNVVGESFLGYASAGTKIFIPKSVNRLGYINGNGENDLFVYLFASGIDIEDVEADINTLYVLPECYADYAEKLKDCESEAKLKKMPEELISFYSQAEISKSVDQSISVTVVPNSPMEEKTKPQGLFSERLEAMIEAALQDGVLTQKEQEVIFRRAEKEGEDLDEFKILFNARIAQLGIKIEEARIEEPSVNQAPEIPQNDSLKGPDGMFSERLEFLIHNAIEDGVITEKERDAIIRRAQAEGEDLDEVDIYIQSLLQKREMGEL